MAAVPFNNAGFPVVVRAISSGGVGGSGGGGGGGGDVTSNGQNLATQATLTTLATESTLQSLVSALTGPPASPSPTTTVAPASNSVWSVLLPSYNYGTQSVSNSQAVNPATGAVWPVLLPSYNYGTQSVSNSQAVNPATNSIWQVSFPSYVFATQSVSNSLAVNPATGSTWAVLSGGSQIATQTTLDSVRSNTIYNGQGVAYWANLTANSVNSIDATTQNTDTNVAGIYGQAQTIAGNTSSISFNMASSVSNLADINTNTTALAGLISSGGLNVNIISGGSGGGGGGADAYTDAALALGAASAVIDRKLINFDQTGVTVGSFILGTTLNISTYPRSTDGSAHAPRFVLGSTNTDSNPIPIIYSGWGGSGFVTGTSTINTDETIGIGSDAVYWINYAMVDYERSDIGELFGFALPLDYITVQTTTTSTPTYVDTFVIDPVVNNSPAFVALNANADLRVFIENIIVTASEPCVIRICVSPGFSTTQNTAYRPAQKTVLMSFNCEANVTNTYTNIWRRCYGGALYVQCDTTSPSIDVRGSVQMSYGV